MDTDNRLTPVPTSQFISNRPSQWMTENRGSSEGCYSLRMNMSSPFVMVAAVVSMAVVRPASGQERPAVQTVVEQLRFHHLHLNSVDPARAAEYYPRPFSLSATKTTFNGYEAVKTGNVYLLFSKVGTTPQNELTGPQTSIWHFGWNTPNSRQYNEKFRAMGLEIAQMWDAADGKLVDMSSDTLPGLPTHEHPLCAMEWYATHLGATIPQARNAGAAPLGNGDCHTKLYAPPTWPSFAKTGFVRDPAGGVNFGDISILIRPWPGGGLVSPRGKIVDHWAVSTSDLTATVARLKREGVTFLEEIHPWGNLRAAMIEGPDRIAIELVEVK